MCRVTGSFRGARGWGMHESDFVKTHRTGTAQRGNFTMCSFLKSFLLKNIKDPFGNCEGKGGRGRRGSGEQASEQQWSG